MVENPLLALEMMKEVLLMVGSETEETVSEMMKEKPTRDTRR